MSRTSLALVVLMASSLARAQTEPPAAATTEPAPPKVDDAKTLYNDGLSLYALGRYAEAAPLFERAFELKHVPALLFNAAQAHRFAGHPQRAITLYESYLHLYGDPSRKNEIEAHIAEMKSLLEAQQQGAPPPAPPTETPGASAPMTMTTTSTAPPATPSSQTLTARSPPKPLIRKPWFWVAVGGGAIVITAVIVGIAVGTRGHTNPPASFGTVAGN